MTCCLTAPSHYLNQCWLPISEVLWHSPESNFTWNAPAIISHNNFEKYTFKIAATSPRDQWVKINCFVNPRMVQSLQWHHISVMSQTTGSPTFYWTVCSGLQQKISKSHLTYSFDRSPVDFPISSSNAEGVSMTLRHRDYKNPFSYHWAHLCHELHEPSSLGANPASVTVAHMMTSSNGNIFRVTGLLCGNSPVPVNSPHKGQWCGALMFSLICVWINGWVNNREAADWDAIVVIMTSV